MLKFFDDNNLVYYPEKQPSSWQEAIKMSCLQLLNKSIVTDEYVEAIIESVNQYGPYIVIAPLIAMPHAAADNPGVKGTAIAFTKFKEPVIFFDKESQEEKPAILFFTLAAEDSDKHLENIKNLMELLCDDAIVEQLLKTNNIEDFKKILS